MALRPGRPVLPGDRLLLTLPRCMGTENANDGDCDHLIITIMCKGRPVVVLVEVNEEELVKVSLSGLDCSPGGGCLPDPLG